MAWRNQTRSPIAQVGAEQRRLDLAGALLAVEPQAAREGGAGEAVAAGRAGGGVAAAEHGGHAAAGRRTTGSAKNAAGRGVKAR